MKSPLQRIRSGALVLAAIFVVAVCGFHLLDPDRDSNWIDDIYMVVITISSVGFSDKTNVGWQLQIFYILVIVFGMSAAAYTVGGFFQLMTEGEIERALGVRRMTREMEKLNNHVVVCGFGRIGQILTAELKHRGRPFIVVERENDRIQEAQSLGYIALNGDALDDEVLETVGIHRANVLVTALAEDADNVFITLTARNLNPDLYIIARGEQSNTQRKLRQAGANRVVQPAMIGAQRMASMITRPSTAEFLELVGDKSKVDVELDEFPLGPESTIVGKTVNDAAARQTHRIGIVAIKPSEGKMLFNPGGDYVFRVGDTLIVMGETAGIDSFRKEFQISDAHRASSLPT